MCIRDRSNAEYSVLVSEEIPSKVECAGPCTFQFETVRFGLKAVDDGLWILGDYHQVVDIACYVFVVVSAISHPNVGFCFGWSETHVYEYVE